jgi:hypothetical protein
MMRTYAEISDTELSDWPQSSDMPHRLAREILRLRADAPQRSKKQERTMADKKLVRVVGNIFGMTLAVDPDVPPDEAHFYVDGERAGTIIESSRHPFKRSS